MPRVFTAKARKDYGDLIKKGQTYYYWFQRVSFRGRGIKRRSAFRPKQSELTQSAFWQKIYSLREGAETTPDPGSVQDGIDSIKSDLEDLKSECESSREAIPEHLQDVSTGEKLANRVSALETVISALESVSPDEEQDDQEDTWQEVRDALDEIDCE